MSYGIVAEYGATEAGWVATPPGWPDSCWGVVMPDVGRVRMAIESAAASWPSAMSRSEAWPAACA